MPVSPTLNGGKVVMQHERLFALAGQAIDDLRIAARARGRHDQGLGLAAREQRGSVRARQYAGADVDRAHRLGVASVDARMAIENALAHQTIFEIEEFGADLIGGELRRIALRKASSTAFLISPIFAWRCCFSVSA
jgi:hypothetical protein